MLNILKNGTITVPNIEERPEVAKHNKLGKQLDAQYNATELEAREVRTRAETGTDNNRAARAAKIAAGETPDAASPSPQLDSILSRLGDFGLARKLHREAGRGIRRREEISICNELKPAYDALAKRFAGNLVALRADLVAMSDLEGKLKAQGIGFFPIVCNLTKIDSVFGSANDRQSDFAGLIRECVEHGHLNDLPKGL